MVERNNVTFGNLYIWSYFSRFYLDCSRNASGVGGYVCMHKVKERFLLICRFSLIICYLMIFTYLF
jgi:hypothetical protein